MASYDDFVHVLTSPQAGSQGGGTTVSEDFFNNTKGDRVYTEGVIVDSIRKKHPKYHLMVNLGYTCDLLAWAASRDDVTCFPHGETKESLVETQYAPPSRRYGDENGGSFLDRVIFGSYDIVFNGNAFLVYVVEGAVGMYSSRYNYILVEDLTLNMVAKDDAQKQANELVAAASKWLQELHGEVLVFDNGFWQKNKELYDNIQKSNWEDVILGKDKKDSIIEDVIGFFDAEKRYAQFGVPWKRGLIFYGPPGNGKTISTKALMHDASKRVSPAVESLYVKSLNSFQGPEYGIRSIFLKARQMAPCLLIFEDIDSLINPMVRSYFLNEVDGLESNHGILMIGSTNHLERLDPGIAKRPSRFDRKYLFDVPNREERIQYCEYWRHKLSKNKEVDFPEEMSAKVADITSDFSFAYMKEAFVAALLAIVRKDAKHVYRSRDDNLSDNTLWRELKKQIENLRKEMEGEDGEDSVATTSSPSMSGIWPGLGSMLEERRTGPMEIRNAMPRYR